LDDRLLPKIPSLQQADSSAKEKVNPPSCMITPSSSKITPLEANAGRNDNGNLSSFNQKTSNIMGKRRFTGKKNYMKFYLSLFALKAYILLFH
jgi:hypothetical protein